MNRGISPEDLYSKLVELCKDHKVYIVTLYKSIEVEGAIVIDFSKDINNKDYVSNLVNNYINKLNNKLSESLNNDTTINEYSKKALELLNSRIDSSERLDKIIEKYICFDNWKDTLYSLYE